MKKTKVFLLCALAMTLILTACSKDASSKEVDLDKEELDNLNEEGMPIVKDEVSIDIFAGQRPASNDNWNDVLLFNKYKEMTNMDINWKMVPEAALEEQRNLALGGGQLPDAFHSADLPLESLVKYGDQGVFIPLNDLIDEYAPNFKKILDENPEVRKAVTMPDGNIYSFPTLHDPDFLALNTGAKPWFREDWLDELNMDIPKTTDDFYEFLKAVKENDLLGDGQDNEVPFGSRNIDDIISWMKGSFGIANRGLTAGNLDLDPDEDKVRFFPITDNYKELLEYLHKLYDEELIEQNIFSLEQEQYYSNAAEGYYASTYVQDPGEMFSGEHKENYVSGFALEGPHGDDAFSGVSHPVVSSGSFVITNENDYPASTVRWIDHFYGDEGARMFLIGFEGETYEKDEDGGYQFVEEIRNNPDGLSLDQAVSRYLTYPGGHYPSIVKKDYFNGAEGSEASAEAAEKLEPNVIDEEPWSSFSHTLEENKKLSSFGYDIEKYVEEMRDKFISGEASFDEWDAYIDKINEMNLDEYMDIMQAAYERYQEN